MISATEQIKIIILYIIFGTFIGITFDSLKILTFNNRTKRMQIISYIIEVIYWIVITYICALFIIKNTSIYITVYSILFFVIGIFIYYSILQKSYNKNFTHIKKYCKDIITKIIPLLLPLELFNYFIIKFKKRKKSCDA